MVMLYLTQDSSARSCQQRSLELPVYLGVCRHISFGTHLGWFLACQIRFCSTQQTQL